ncbi:RING finger protein 32-like [Porites lutea]|uniref:RING finger protein 32-like n=1 Tax=Porites lutea TaxID=51062 RepID=UPI003CC59262
MAYTKPQKMSERKSRKNTSSMALAAVALQDHMVRSLSLHDPLKKKKINHSLPVKNSRNLTSTEKRSRKDEDQKKEYVLDPKPAPLTLAQKLGLVEAPEVLLSDKEWKEVKEKSNARQDSSQPCVICKEDFGLQQQVLLSCSHVFHRTCLEAFEKFSGRKSCPMCRKEQYQRRIIHEGAREYRVKCTTRIQAAWRGYLVRQWYKKLRESVPPNDPKLRKKFYEDKFHSINARLLQSMEARNQSVDELLSEIDQSIAASRHTMRQLDKNAEGFIEGTDWEQVQLQAVQRCVTDCPICIMPLTSKGLYKKKNQSRPTVLLSCSHVFHATCLDAFEEFSLDRKPVCPVCRSHYYKKLL